jgi:hypothetical protein
MGIANDFWMQQAVNFLFGYVVHTGCLYLLKIEKLKGTLKQSMKMASAILFFTYNIKALYDECRAFE